MVAVNWLLACTMQHVMALLATWITQQPGSHRTCLSLRRGLWDGSCPGRCGSQELVEVAAC
jgi:hypothetical protein